MKSCACFFFFCRPLNSTGVVKPTSGTPTWRDVSSVMWNPLTSSRPPCWSTSRTITSCTFKPEPVFLKRLVCHIRFFFFLKNWRCSNLRVNRVDHDCSHTVIAEPHLVYNTHAVTRTTWSGRTVTCLCAALASGRLSAALRSLFFPFVN